MRIICNNICRMPNLEAVTSIRDIQKIVVAIVTTTTVVIEERIEF